MSMFALLPVPTLMSLMRCAVAVMRGRSVMFMQRAGIVCVSAVPAVSMNVVAVMSVPAAVVAVMPQPQQRHRHQAGKAKPQAE